MKLSSLIITLLLLPGFAFTQVENYNVLNVVGQIKMKSSGKVIARGDVVSSEDQVVFLSADAMAAVFSPSKGRFTLKAKPDQAKGSEYLAFVKNSIIPSTQSLAVRNVDLSNIPPPDMNDEMCGRNFLILEGTTLLISTEKYPVDADHFFFLRMVWAGEEISKKLPSENALLALNAADILSVDGKYVAAEELSNFRLFYYDAAAKNSTLVCAFTPVFAHEELKDEAGIIVKTHRAAQTDEETIRTEVRDYLEEYYGAPAQQVFLQWYERYFGR